MPYKNLRPLGSAVKNGQLVYVIQSDAKFLVFSKNDFLDGSHHNLVGAALEQIIPAIMRTFDEIENNVTAGLFDLRQWPDANKLMSDIKPDAPAADLDMHHITLQRINVLSNKIQRGLAWQSYSQAFPNAP